MEANTPSSDTRGEPARTAQGGDISRTRRKIGRAVLPNERPARALRGSTKLTCVKQIEIVSLALVLLGPDGKQIGRLHRLVVPPDPGRGVRDRWDFGRRRCRRADRRRPGVHAIANPRRDRPALRATSPPRLRPRSRCWPYGFRWSRRRCEGLRAHPPHRRPRRPGPAYPRRVQDVYDELERLIAENEQQAA